MSKNLTINGVAYNGVSNVTIGSAIFRDADEVITTPTATKTITENGTDIDILNYSKATVNVPVGVQPSGTLVLNLSESVADRDCANYAKVTVNITKDASAPVLSSISATYSGGTVEAGTTLTQLTGISITATYTMTGYTGNITKSGITTGYTLSGALTAGQTNTITVSYGGKTSTIQVPVAAEPLVLDKLVVTYDNSTPVEAGTALSALNEVVKAQYTNGTQTAALTEGTDYELSGTLTAGQTNTITVTGKGTYAGLTAVTFSVTVKTAVISVTGVSVSPNAKDITAGESFTITATIAPSNATNKSVTWTSTAPSVASVTGNGLTATVNALTAGSASIKAVTADGSYEATCAVTVEAATASNYWVSETTAGGNAASHTFSIPGLSSTDFAKIQYIDIATEQKTKATTPGTGLSKMGLKKEDGVWNVKYSYMDNSNNQESVTLSSVALDGEGIKITISGLMFNAALKYWITCYDSPSSLPVGNANQYWSQSTIGQESGNAGTKTFAFVTRNNKGLIKQNEGFTSITINQDNSYLSPTYNAASEIRANQLTLTKSDAEAWTGIVTYTVYSTGATATASATATVSTSADETFGYTLISLTAKTTSGVNISFCDSGKVTGTVVVA